MSFDRASGILLHPTSLPGNLGIGDLGAAAFSFCDKLAASGQKYWQILPLGPTGYGDSPYQAFSAFAGNTLLVSPEKLVEDGLISLEDIDSHPQFDPARVDYGGVFEWKTQLLIRAYEGFRRVAGDEVQRLFDAFAEDNKSWLDDYALYRAVKAWQDQRPWYEWPEELKFRQPDALCRAIESLADQLRAEKFYQFLVQRQWAAVKAYANEVGLKIIGDVPIFVALDSADVWCNQRQFKLHDDGSPKVVAGVPPDYFSATGQLWGNPIYDWDAMKADGFQWWIARLRNLLKEVDVIRLDHFRGFSAAWEVPGSDQTAENGSWVDVPGNEFFSAVQAALGELPVIAEDLGVITPDVIGLRDHFGFPGMHILQYAFGGDANNGDLPHNYVRNCVAYTGTHDNDTTAGWFDSLPDDSHEKEYCLRYLRSDGSEIHWDLIRAAWSSVADIAIAPIQDLLGLGNEARMNLPSTSGGNWSWRMTDTMEIDAAFNRLRIMTDTYGRRQGR